MESTMFTLARRKYSNNQITRKRPRRCHALLAILSVALAASVAPAQVPVTVQQVEAFENPPTNTHYAPVNFAGSATATSGAFPGITFHAQANMADTLSGHAGSVANQFYAPGTFANPFINSVFNQSANNFINSLNTQGV